ncbi:FAD:protein FMN transferase [termite gut metagenome]|uniref:FAD:protein FMN transferase n=1 Tax=termite gut metagenome TaxID=433724 RepID=A0A5J4QDI7_9ZZZZ
MTKHSSKLHFLWLLLAFIPVIVYLFNDKNSEPAYNSIDGKVFGTLYNITYQHDGNLKPEIEEEFKRFDASLSPFNTESIITKVNYNIEVKTDTFFRNVFRRAMELSAETDGAFDITTALLVNAWNFGFKKESSPTASVIDSLLQITGYQKIILRNDSVVKQDPRIMINCSAIAKGYASDVIAQFLDRKGIKNYMINIGGEIVVKGKNSSRKPWLIGINKPIDDSLSANQEIQTLFRLTDVGVATSGNYRNYYYKDGKKYAHIIDSHTGYPVTNNLLSATVIAKDCISADAYATAFMVMGFEKSKRFLDVHPEIVAYFIYYDEKEGGIQDWYSENSLYP